MCYAPIHNLWPALKPVDWLRSGSAYSVSKPVWFKLAYCVDRVDVQARATCSHGDRYDAALTWFKARARLHWGQLRWRIANYSVFILCWQCRCSTGSSGSPPVFHECTSYSRVLDCTGSSGMHLRWLFPHSTAIIMLSCKLTMCSCNAPLAHMLRSLVLLRCSAMLPL